MCTSYYAGFLLPVYYPCIPLITQKVPIFTSQEVYAMQIVVHNSYHPLVPCVLMNVMCQEEKDIFAWQVFICFVHCFRIRCDSFMHL